MSNYFPNQYIYLLDNDNAVLSDKLEDYIKHFFTDFVSYRDAEFVSYELRTNFRDIQITYKMLSENCSDCEEKGVTEGYCPDEWYETIDYKIVDLYG